MSLRVNVPSVGVGDDGSHVVGRRLFVVADYPSNTVPNKVTHLFQAQLFHDRSVSRWLANQRFPVLLEVD